MDRAFLQRVIAVMFSVALMGAAGSPTGIDAPAPLPPAQDYVLPIEDNFIEVGTFFEEEIPVADVTQSERCTEWIVGRGVCKVGRTVSGPRWKCEVDEAIEEAYCEVTSLDGVPTLPPICVGNGNPCSILDYVPRSTWARYEAERIPCGCTSSSGSRFDSKKGTVCDANQHCQSKE